MKTFQFNKLVRDKIPDAIKNRGGIVIARKLTRKEYIWELVKKLTEESTELNSSLSSQQAAEELVDIAEVVAALQKVFKVSDTKLRSIRQNKNLKNGAFDKRLFIDSVKVSDNDPWINHYRKNSNRYPEIKSKRLR